MDALVVNNISKSYGSLKALDDVSLKIKKGEMFSLLGPNGSGKTTLISIISTLLKADDGCVEIFGEKVAPENQNTKRVLGVVPQEIVNHGFFSVEEILYFISGYYGLYKNKERVHFLINKLGLEEHRKKLVRQLSGGMKRRLLIAKALVHSPKILLLDEPTAGVDIELRNSMWEFIKELNRDEEMAILLTTHYLEEAEELCDQVAIISHGKLLKSGKTKDLIKDLTQRELIITLSEPAKEVSSQFLTKNSGTELSFTIPNNMKLGMLLKDLDLDRSLIVDMQIKEGSLEDAFLNVVKEN
ncbi:MAG: ABC transporter ATP-binding protein [Bdellovibrionales bacterium]